MRVEKLRNREADNDYLKVVGATAASVHHEESIIQVLLRTPSGETRQSTSGTNSRMNGARSQGRTGRESRDEWGADLGVDGARI